MDLTSLFNLILSINPFLFLKFMISILLLFYIIFAFVMIRQHKLMATVIEVPLSQVLRILVLAHFLGAILVFLLAVLIL